MEFKYHQKFWNIDSSLVKIIKDVDGKTTEVDEWYYYITPIYVCDICKTWNGITWAYGGLVDKSKPNNKSKFISVRTPINQAHQDTSTGNELSWGVFKTKADAIKGFKERYNKATRLRFKDLDDRKQNWKKPEVVIIPQDE